MNSSPKQIGIALVEHDGSYLVGLRQLNQVLAGCAEFPGGKCEPGESPRDCAVRECREETGLTVFAHRLLDRVYFRYPYGEVELHFWICSPLDPAAIEADHQAYRWVQAADLAALNFPEANRPVIALLQSLAAETAEALRRGGNSEPLENRVQP